MGAVQEVCGCEVVLYRRCGKQRAPGPVQAIWVRVWNCFRTGVELLTPHLFVRRSMFLSSPHCLAASVHAPIPHRILKSDVRYRFVINIQGTLVQ